VIVEANGLKPNALADVPDRIHRIVQTTGNGVATLPRDRAFNAGHGFRHLTSVICHFGKLPGCS
jgi:hypothetical protein